MTPGQWVPVKFALLLLLLNFALAYRSVSRRHLCLRKGVETYIASVIVLYFATLLGWLFGFYRENPGAIDNIGLYFIYPFVWVSFFLVNGLEATKKILIKTSFYAGVSLSVLILLAAFFELAGFDSYAALIFSAFGIVSGSQFDGLKLSAPFLPYLIFAYAMLLEIGIRKANKSEEVKIIGQKKAFRAAVLILAALSISGRTVMLICIIWFFVRSVPYSLTSHKRIGSLVVVAMGLFWLLDFNQINLALESKLGFSPEPSEIGVRRISQLIEGFQLVANEPWFGYGVGHYFQSVSDWRIEVTPVMVLVAHGVIITAILAGFYLLILYRLTKRYNMHYLANSSFLFIVASTTNPILLKFDFIWVLLLPFVTFGMIQFQAGRNKINANSV